MTHAIERTNPTGVPFRGKCMKCGQEDLPMSAALVDCPADNIMSDEAALLDLIPNGKGDEG